MADLDEYGYRNWGWNQITVGATNIGSRVSAADAARLESTGSDRLYAPQGETYSTWYDHRVRVGAASSLQYRPDGRIELSLDLIYTGLSNHRNDYALAAAGTNGLTGDISGTQLVNSVSLNGDTITGASFSHVDLRSEYNVMKDSTQFYQRC